MTTLAALFLIAAVGRAVGRAAWRCRHRKCRDWWNEQSARVLCATGPVRLYD